MAQSQSMHAISARTQVLTPDVVSFWSRMCGTDDSSSCDPSSVATRVKSYDDSSMSLELLDEFEETTQQWRGQLTEYDTLSDIQFSLQLSTQR